MYFGVGGVAYGQAAAVPCEVWIEESNNRPNNWSLREKADSNPEDYFVYNFEEVYNISNRNNEILLRFFY